MYAKRRIALYFLCQLLLVQDTHKPSFCVASEEVRSLLKLCFSKMKNPFLVVTFRLPGTNADRRRSALQILPKKNFPEFWFFSESADAALDIMIDQFEEDDQVLFSSACAPGLLRSANPDSHDERFSEVPRFPSCGYNPDQIQWVYVTVFVDFSALQFSA